MEVAIIALAVGMALEAAAICYLGYKGFQAKDREGDARELAAQRVAEAQVDARKVEEANIATTSALAGVARQKTRGDALEKELSDEAHPPGSGGARLRVLSEASAAVPDPGPGTGAGGGGS